jgi:hypothetical protein
MTVVSERNPARASGAVHRLLAVALLLTASACLRGSSTNATTPTGVIGPTGGGGTSSGGSPYAGLYTLQDVDDSTLPFQLAYDSVTGADTMRVFQAWIDSSFISLNDDSTAVEMDYLEIRDVRTATDSSFNREISFGDTLTGSYSVTSTTITVQLTDTISGEVNVTYTIAGSGTFSGAVPYALYNTDNQLAASGTATYTFAYSGAPLDDAALPGHKKVLQSRRFRVPLERAAVGSVAATRVRSTVRPLRVPAWALARLLSSAPARTRP